MGKGLCFQRGTPHRHMATKHSEDGGERHTQAYLLVSGYVRLAKRSNDEQEEVDDHCQLSIVIVGPHPLTREISILGIRLAQSTVGQKYLRVRAERPNGSRLSSAHLRADAYQAFLRLFYSYLENVTTDYSKLSVTFESGV
jgi:hypothetical protein